MRKVKVGLEADVVGFVGQVKVAKNAVDDLGDEVQQLDKELDKIPADAAKAGAALKLLNGDVESVGKHVNDLGHGTAAFAALDAKIRTTKAEVRKLADEFVKTGDVDVFKKLGDAQGRLGSLMKIRKNITESIEDGVEDAAASPALGQVAQKIGIGLAAGMAVPLVAALGGAIAGATGFGVAGLGLAGAVLGDPERFGYAWNQQLRELKAEFINASEPFKNELYGVIAGIGPLVQSWHLDKVLGDAVKYVQPLAHGVEGFATGIVRGVGVLVEKGEPAVNALSQGMIRLGQASEHAMESIADGAEGGAKALHDVSNGVALLIEGFGGLIGLAEKFYGFASDHPIQAGLLTVGLSAPISLYSKTVGEADSLTSQLTTTQHGLQLQAEAAGHAFSAQGDDLSALSQQLNAATLSGDALAATMVNKIFTALMSLDQATLGIAESHTRLQQTFEDSRKILGKHADQLDINTERGQANRESVLAAVTANMQLYQAQVAAGMSSEDAAKSYDENTKALEEQLKKAHLTQEQIDGLIGKYREVPDEVNTTIAIEGLTAAITELTRTIQLIAGIKSKDVYVRVHNQVYNETTGRRQTGNSRLGEDTSKYGRIVRAAEGLIVPPSNPGTMLFGEPETGGEAYIPLKGISSTRAAMLGQIAMSGYGYNVVPQGGGGMPRELVLNATFIDPMTGDVMRRTAIRWSLDRGRDPSTFLTSA